MTTNFGIAGIQCGYAELGVDKPLEGHLKRLELAKTIYPWVRMMVMPELAAPGFGTQAAEDMDGPMLREFRACARDLGIWLVPGSIYEREGDDIFNVASVINPDGDVVSRYKKMFPFEPYEKNVTAGTEPCVFEVPEVGKFGLMICYDIWFPEVARALVWGGAEVLFCPTLTATIDRDFELSVARATAGLNQAAVFSINVSRPTGAGLSTICNQDGDAVYTAGEGTEIMPWEVDFAAIRTARERGLRTLGQPLKSFRDHRHAFAQYDLKKRSPAFDALGALKKPE